MAASRVDARGPRMPGACWGCAGQGWTSGGALQDGPGQGRVGRARAGRAKVVTASRMNRPTTGVELSVRHSRPHSHSASLVTTCPQPSPTIVQSRPDALDRLSFSPVFPRPLPGPDRTAMTSVRSQLLWLVHASGPAQNGSALQDPQKFSQTTTDNTAENRPVLVLDGTTRHAAGAAGTRNLQCLQSLGYHSAPHAAVGHQVPVTLLL